MNPEELLKGYKDAHSHPRFQLMTGTSIRRHTREFVNFCKTYIPNTVLDYGCGKGYQYTEHNIHLLADIPMPTLYDPAIPEFSELPKGTFDSVICTDVMEHVHMDKCDETLLEIFSKSKHSVFFTISCNPAKKHFPDGTNYHVNCKPEEWWFATIKRLKPKHLKVWLIFPSFKGIIKYDKEETR